MPVDQRAASIRKVLHWVDADLKPHMAWEESWLFPHDRCARWYVVGDPPTFDSIISRSRHKPSDCVRTAPARHPIPRETP